jgi:hypothetical protein
VDGGRRGGRWVGRPPAVPFPRRYPSPAGTSRSQAHRGQAHRTKALRAASRGPRGTPLPGVVAHRGGSRSGGWPGRRCGQVSGMGSAQDGEVATAPSRRWRLDRGGTRWAAV